MEYLSIRSDKYLDEMIYFLWDEFNVMISEPTMQRTLNHMWYTWKIVWIPQNQYIDNLDPKKSIGA